ncbi:MAG: single-strand DNA-binding protein [Frankiales bacterium]|jgi:single-strand DNA-binding protein|nr:single-strand DNA-binding protein [Frankiales bacterium]
MNDNQISLVGNIVRDPVIRKVSDKATVTTFRLASTPRRFDPSISEWRNLDSLYLTVSCWNKLAERVANCLQGGDPVVVSGRLRMRTYEIEGRQRTVYEVDAQQVAPDLTRISVELVRTGRPRGFESVPDEGPDLSRDMASLEPLPGSGPLLPIQAEPAA